jgi:putative transposase
MPRMARIVYPGVPHHIIQRGNRRQRVFFSDEDKALYLRLLVTWGERAGVRIWAYCLMDNHVHHVAVPEREDSLAVAIGQTHKLYTIIVNKREGWSGYLWQGRFISFPMDMSYLYRAMRYDELNPVRAKIVAKATDYRWSSARAHVLGASDPLVSGNPLRMTCSEWEAYLSKGLTDNETALFRAHESTGLPLGDDDFLRKIGFRE